MMKSLLTLLLAVGTLSLSGWAMSAEPLPDKSIFDDGYPESAPVESLTLSFEQLGLSKFKLDGVSSNTRVEFTNRLDRLGKKLTLNFSYTYSPSLIGRVSHLKIFFNENLVTVLPIDDKNTVLGSVAEHSVALNPKLIKDFNQVRFELIGYYDLVCQDDYSKTIWAEIGKSSHISIERQSLALESLLEYFPAPFFDSRDYTKLTLPFIFSSQPDEPTLEAAAALSSFFGAQAKWRKAQFPVHINSTPTEHSVVFATNDNKPDFLLNYPDVDKPTIEIISSPTHRYAKVLLVLGKNTEQLKEAVVGLVFGYKVMTGRSATVDAIASLPLRKAYDAPLWVRSDRAVSFDEFIEYPTQLQSQGFRGQPVRLDLRFAPDLFTWRENGIPITLNYRNTPVEHGMLSRLNMLINGKFVDGFILENDHGKTITTQTLLPLLSDINPSQSRQDFELTGLDLTTNNQLTYDFNFAVVKTGECSAIPAGGEFGAIDGSSTIDVSKFHHYIALPNLRAFASGGFPFTKYADLHQSTLVMEANSSTNAISLLLNFTGHLGAITGYPAHRLSIQFPSSQLDFADKDIVIIGKPDSFLSSVAENSSLSVLIDNNQRIVDQAIYNGAYDSTDAEKIKVNIRSLGRLAIISGFQSPFDSDRSVVSLIATNDNAYSLLTDALLDNAKTSQIMGSSAIINNQGIKTIKTDDQYFVGHVPIHTLIWFHFSDQPLLLAILSILTLLLISFMLWRLLMLLTKKRLSEGDKA
ncbi:cellulose biosynthesis cyclic di-GMP-binding regulatory protein BcsB [Pseudoalteromonas sp. MB41]|uniref:cellulose biosynthesis cyclic di-GMP-binding regulatory protein BcsB n=1 Tax=unclassified Pseudoalteromonas TaxID=194690 RepID=UPI0015D55530|nr:MULTISPECIES: cellulose biosynthesis cyclic di-GMP-binding regulatory protein BcsB [unclassified Pseudoalteromonas]MCC9659388.1 cellulose biosynthesis cyclic di-GMP-binding regulatory protein BcsB [Pseudoalteromonas sp. MB41]QLJ07351.1 cellulose biosynthesis cyclic di-GMP-binding regulatory protein BcsB [Pseudoalteromonas sp. JSTW]